MQTLFLRVVVAAVLVAGGAFPARGQKPTVPTRPVLGQVVGSGAMECYIAAGRIAMSGKQSFNMSTNVVGGTERLSLRPGPDQAFVEYEYATKSELLTAEFKDPGQFKLIRRPRGDQSVVSVEFHQAGAQPVKLIVGEGSARKQYQAGGLWHLLVAEKEVCREHLIPLLELFRGSWGLAERTGEIEEELLHSVDEGQYLDHQRWQELVRQLADDRFSKRQAADRELRAAGPVVIAFLEQLDYQRLEPEQQARIQAIVAELSRGLIDDTPQQAVAAMAGAPQVWAALLERPELEHRRTALAQLRKLLTEPIDFDPAAEPDVRRQQLAALRSQLDKR